MEMRGATIDYKTYVRYPRKVSVGAGTTINRGCRFYASHHFKDVRIRIGNHVAVAPEVSFFAAGHDYTKLALPDTAGSITVGDYAWIGARSVILQGVTIGEGAVIAAVNFGLSGSSSIHGADSGGKQLSVCNIFWCGHIS